MKKIVYDIFIEMIAIFVGVMVAFTVNNWQEQKANTEKAQKHFSMLKTELSKDLQVIARNKEKYRQEVELVDELGAALTRKDYPSFEGNSALLGNELFFYTKIEVIESIMESNDFVVIYDQKLFSSLNNLKEDCKTLNYIGERVEYLKRQLEDATLEFQLSDPNTKEKVDRKLLLLLERYRTELVNKEILNLAVYSGYKEVIEELGN